MNKAIWSAEALELAKLYKTLNDNLPILSNEIEPLIKSNDANVVLLYARRSLEVIVTELCETELKRPRKTEPLKGIIDKLNSEDKVPSHIITSMHSLNSLATFGTHPKDFDPEQVKPVLSNLSVVIKWYLKFKGIEISLLPLSENILITEEGAKSDFSKLEKSIAILPFRNDSPNEENTYFINGVMEEILNNLQKIRDIRVISRTSVELYRNQAKSIPEIARELGVNYIVEGSAQKYGNNFRLRAQLIMAAKETHLWGESFQQKIADVEDIFNIQIKIAESIAKDLKAVISPEEKRLIEKIPTADLAVYDEYLKARSYLNDFSREALDKALEYLNSGVEKNPDWAPLYAGLIQVWMVIQQQGYEPPAMTGPKIMENLNKALELDPDLPEAHYFNAMIAHLVEWNWEKSEKEFLKALALNPNDSLSRILYSQLLAAVLHRYDEGLAQGKLAFSLDPLNPNMKCWYAATLLAAGDFKTGLSLAEEAAATDPGNLMAYSAIIMAACRFKDYDKVIKSERYLLPSLIEQDKFNEIERVYHETGIVSAYKDILKHLEKFAEKNYVSFLDMAFRYLIVNISDKAMDWIEKGFEMHDPQMSYISTTLYYLDPLFNNPRFIAICGKMNLPLPKN
jgi:TolB-like protein